MKKRNILGAAGLFLGSALLSASAASGDSKSAGKGGFAFTESPSIAKAPAAPLAASLDGQLVELKNILIESGEKSWTFAARADGDSLSVGPRIALFQSPAVGAAQSAKITDGCRGSFLPLAVGKAVKLAWSPKPLLEMAPPSGISSELNGTKPKEVVSWSGGLAYAVQFTKWDAQPYSEQTKDHEAGKASGRVVVMMKGEEDSKNGWIAGTFTDVPISYRNEPPLCAKACVVE